MVITCLRALLVTRRGAAAGGAVRHAGQFDDASGLGGIGIGIGLAFVLLMMVCQPGDVLRWVPDEQSVPV